MKKIIAFLMLALLCAASLTALDMSAGGSVGLNVQPTNMKAEFMGQTIIEEEYTPGYMTLTGFFDATWLVAQTGVQLFIGASDGRDAITWEDAQEIWLSASLFAKYPIQAGAFTFAPMAGFELNKILSASTGGTSLDISDYPLYFSIKGGIAADFALSPKLYLRSTALFGYRFLTDEEKDLISAMEVLGATYSITPFHLDVTVGIGFKF